MKSLCASGINQNFCNHFPYPLPKKPPPPIANNACSFCHQICFACGSTFELMKYVNLFWMYANLSLTMPAIPPNINPAVIQPNKIQRIYFIFAPAYRHIISPTIPKIITVPRSGINKKTKKRRALSIINEMKNSLVFVLSRFLISHHERKSTYHNLKNSDG
jgi:hypothetical protein